MHLFTRTCGISAGHTGEALALAIAAPVAAWINVYGAPPDTVIFAARFESQAAAAPSFLSLEGVLGDRCFLERRVDSVGEVMLDLDRRGAPAAFADILTVECQPGHVAAATARTVENANEVARAAGCAIAVVRVCHGQRVTLRRITIAETLAELDEAQERIAMHCRSGAASDGDRYLVPGSGRRRQVRRLG